MYPLVKNKQKSSGTITPRSACRRGGFMVKYYIVDEFVRGVFPCQLMNTSAVVVVTGST